MNRPTSKAIADARAVLLADRKARKAARPQRIDHKAEPIKAGRGRERDGAYLAWLRRLPCVACMVEGGNCGPTEAAHLRFSDARRGRINPGLQSKPSDRFATPLGHGHHQHDQHQRQEQAFWSGLGIDAGDLTEALYAAFQAGGDGMAVLQQFTGRSQ